MSEDTDRDVSSVSTDGHSTQFLSPADQAAEDRRLAERRGLKKTKTLNGFFRLFRVKSEDRP